MKTQKLVLAIFLSFLFLGSCVSSKKYKEALSSQAKSEEQYGALYEDYQHLAKEKDKLLAASNENGKELKMEEQALNERESKIRDLENMINTERNAIANLKQEVCSALKCFTPDELTIEVREGKLYVSMSDKLLFPSGSETVNARGKQAISMLATVLANSDLEVMVEGHTDVVPISNARNKDNWDLSVHRATTITRIMLENGIKPQRIIASGRAEFHPLANNATAEGRQANRRTEIVLAPKLDKLWDLTKEDNNASTRR